MDRRRAAGMQSIYTRLVERSRDSFLVIDGNGLIVFCNPAAGMLLMVARWRSSKAAISVCPFVPMAHPFRLNW